MHPPEVCSGTCFYLCSCYSCPFLAKPEFLLTVHSVLLRDARFFLAEATLLVLANLVSDSVDSDSAATKIALLQCDNAASTLIACLDDIDDAQTLSFAVGALQNLCHDREWSTLLVAQNVHSTFEALLNHTDPMIVRYASGALKNISVTLQEKEGLFSQQAASAVSERSFEADLEEFKYRRAGAIIVRAINNLGPDARLRRLLKSKERQNKAVAASSKLPTAVVAEARLKSAGEKLAAARRATGSMVPGRSAASSSSGGTGQQRKAAVPAAAPKSPGSDASSSHSGSTAYYSVASSASAAKLAAGAAPPAPPPACFEV